jgi:hypothetical protein
LDKYWNYEYCRGITAGAGTQIAALAFGGYNGTANTAATESFNGTSWTTVNSMNTARSSVGGVGLQTAALAFGGNDPAPGFLQEQQKNMMVLLGHQLIL